MKGSLEPTPPAGFKLGVVFSLGLFSLAAQALMFRLFLSVYEGNELGVGAFFASWLLWVGVGAWLGRGAARRRVPRSFEMWPLLYLAAFLVQRALVLRSRTLAGVAPYEMFPFTRMFAVSLLVNAPVSLVSGLLFVLACEWTSADRALPVAWVYVFDALGSFAAGVAVTLLLGRGLPGERVFLLAGLVVALASGACRLAYRPGPAAALPALVLLGLLIGRADRIWTERADRRAWQRLLPREAYRGSFATAQAKYLYGVYDGQFNVLAWETVAETLPNTEYASELVALSLAQKPDARRVLVIGPGSLAVAQRFCELPQIERVTWAHPDPEYPARLLAVLPPEYRRRVERLDMPRGDVRRVLRVDPRPYDLALLALPDATTLALNRYRTREFFTLLKSRLGSSGVLCVRVAGGENYLGTELANVGASLWQTLQEVFARVTVKPGDETWFVASDEAPITASPAVLRARFAAVEGAEKIYPAVGLLSLYLEDRAQFQMARYQEAATGSPREVLVNEDRRPRALLHTLLFIACHARPGLKWSDRIAWVARRGPTLSFSVLALIALGRMLARRRSTADLAPGALAPADARWLVFTTGAAGLSSSMVLMFLLQARHGSLYLLLGLVSSLYMLGIFVGGMASERLLVAGRQPPRKWLAFALALHGLLLAFLSVLPPELPLAVYAVLFLLAGGIGGFYVPLAAESWRRHGFSARAAGALTDLADHWGGATGAALTGLVLLPLLGTGPTLGVLAALLATNLVAYLTPGAVQKAKPALTLGAYLAAATGALLLLERVFGPPAPSASPLPAAPEAGAVSSAPPAASTEAVAPKRGRPREADVAALLRKIQRGELSDREAEYYQPLGLPNTTP